MRKTSLPVVLALSILALATVVAWAQDVTYTPSEPGNIFTVIDAPRSQGQAQATVVTLTDGTTSQSRTFAAPYQRCRETTPAGIVLKMHNPQPSKVRHVLSTNGTIVRPPYVGDTPPEALHPCYRLVTF